MATLMRGSAVRLPRWLRAGRRSPRDAAPLIGVVILGALLIWQCVNLLWALIVPLAPLGAWQPQTAVIASPAERRAIFSSFDPFFRSGPQGPVSATVTSLGLTLFGINLNEATGGGSAIIAGDDGLQNSYAVGDEIAPGVKLVGVAFDHVLLDRGGTRESLFLDQSGDAPVANPATPLPAPTGDVIRSVNGRPIGSAADAAALASQFAPGARVSLEVERGASVVPVALFLSKQ